MMDGQNAVCEEGVLEALEGVIDPELGLDFVTLGLIYGVEIRGGDVEIVFSLTAPGCPIGPQVALQMVQLVGALEGVRSVTPRLVLTRRGQRSASARTRALRSDSEAARVTAGRVARAGPASAAAPGVHEVLGDAEGFAVVAALMIVAGGLVAAVNSAAPFAHGSWLAAYLVLVGGVAQLVLGAGRLVLPAPRRSVRLRHAQLGLWNAGIAVVAVGVFVDLAAIVLAGSAVVLVALGCFAVGGGRGEPGARGRVLGYRLVIGVLAISVLVGSVLAGAAPGS